MRFLNNLFGKKEQPIRSYEDFWAWFQTNEQKFYAIVKSGKNPEKDFFDKLSPKLEELKDGFFYMSGMLDDNTAELVLTPDGMIKNIVFVEELVEAAPPIPNWKFTALKPALDIENVRIDMAGYFFGKENLSFYSIDNSNYPDEVEIKYEGDDNGMPDDETYEFLNNFEEEIMLDLKDFEGYLNVGRQTADHSREIYFACKDFRKPSKVLYKLTKKYSGQLDLTYDIYKDKYWRSFERFRRY